MMSSKRNDLLAAAVKEWIGTYHEGIRTLPLRGGKRCIDLAHAAGYDGMQLPAQRPRRLLHSFALVSVALGLEMPATLLARADEVIE